MSAQWDGVPGDSGAYVLRSVNGDEFPAWWSAPSDHWTLRGGAHIRAAMLAETGTVLVAPCPTPADLAAAVQAERERVREAFKKRIAEVGVEDDHHSTPTLDRLEARGRKNAAREIHDVIRALDLGPTDALAFYRRQVVAKCVLVARKLAQEGRDPFAIADMLEQLQGLPIAAVKDGAARPEGEATS